MQDRDATLSEQLTRTCAMMGKSNLPPAQREALQRGLLALLTAMEYHKYECDESKTGVVVPEHQWPEHARWLGCLMEMLQATQRRESAA